MFGTEKCSSSAIWLPVIQQPKNLVEISEAGKNF